MEDQPLSSDRHYIFIDTAKDTESYTPKHRIFMFDYYLHYIHQTPYIRVLQIAVYL